MKFAAFAVFTPLALAGVLPQKKRALEKKDLDERQIFGAGPGVIIGAITAVKDAAQSLDSTIEGIDSADLTALLALQTGSAQIVTTIQEQTSVVQDSADIGLLSALPVQGAATGLIAELKKTLSDLVSKRSFIDQAGVTSLVITALQQQKEAGDGFSAALTDKVPQLVSILAELDGGVIDVLFDKAIAAFQSSSGTSSGGGSGGATASAGAPAASST